MWEGLSDLEIPLLYFQRCLLIPARSANLSRRASGYTASTGAAGLQDPPVPGALCTLCRSNSPVVIYGLRTRTTYYSTACLNGNLLLCLQYL